MSGIGRNFVPAFRWNNNSNRYRSQSVNDHERIDSTEYKGEFNGIAGTRDQTNECSKTYNHIHYPQRPDFETKSQKSHWTDKQHHRLKNKIR